MAIFFNSLGGALSISIAQNIFSNGLKTEVPKYAPNVSAQDIIAAGSTHLRETVNATDLPGVLAAYSKALWWNSYGMWMFHRMEELKGEECYAWWCLMSLKCTFYYGT